MHQELSPWAKAIQNGALYASNSRTEFRDGTLTAPHILIGNVFEYQRALDPIQVRLILDVGRIDLNEASGVIEFAGARANPTMDFGVTIRE